MSGLTDRIAEVLLPHEGPIFMDGAGTLECFCGFDCAEGPHRSDEELWATKNWAAHVAAAVAAELQLTEETHNRLVLTYDDPPSPKETNRCDVPGRVWATHYELVPSSRHVSEWEPRIEHSDPLRPWSEEQ